NVGAALLGLDDLSRLAAEPREASLSSLRPRRDLSFDRGHVHAVHARRDARRVGLDAALAGVEYGSARRVAESNRRPALPAALDLPVSGDGLVSADRGAHHLAARACVRP